MKHKSKSHRKESNVSKIARLNWNAYKRLIFRLAMVEHFRKA